CRTSTRSRAFRTGTPRRSGLPIRWRAASTTASSIPIPGRSALDSICVCDSHGSATMRLRRLLASLLLGATLAGCTNLDLQDRIVGEAKFIRALMYLNLVTLYGNVPLITTPPQPTDRPATVGPPELWAQIEQDLTQARPVLPRSYSGNDLGRATWGAATAL